MNLIIGSGPAGVSVAMALIARGQNVTLIDAGKDLSADLSDRRDHFAANPAEAWTNENHKTWQTPQLEKTGDLSMRFGSIHAQNPLSDTFADETVFAGRSSHAVGGLSNVWGAAVLPYRQEDIASWPISAADLAPHYQAVSQFMPIAGSPNDDLQGVFPAFDAGALKPLDAGPQANTLLDRLNSNRVTLAEGGISVGSARQAVRNGCHLCGQCLHGCPWAMIYSAQQTLETLKQSELFSYRSGAAVTEISEDGDTCRVRLADGAVITADRLFLATGVYETARLVLGALPETDNKLLMQDSRQFFLPMLQRWSSGRDPAALPLHTLAKLFIEIDHAEVSPYLTHSQIYSWNEFYAREMIANYGRKLPGSQALFGAIAKRLIVAQTFIHSDHCDQVELTLETKTGRLKTEIVSNPDMHPTINRAASILSKAMSKAGLLPLSFAKRVEGPGASFHSGGTLPMSASPTTLQTDPLGRLSGFNTIHVVDASVLPSIPASTITFTVMANAHRIGTLV